jgi:cyclopropane fatty-acyl-phospholipid synthase-like methyltransferase
MPTNEEIKNYYDFSKLDYQIYNAASSNISMHFGIWDENIKSHKEALLNENKVLAELAKINRDDYVLDVGCGYGTTAIWLAKNIGCKVIGITISEKQVAEAKNTAKKYGVEHLTDFRVMNFHKIEFPENTFDAVISIESICHSSNQPVVLKEIYHVLKPAGTLAIVDGYFAKDTKNLTAREKEIARICFEGVHVPPLAQQKEFESWLKQTDFQNVQWFNKTPYILKISKRISNLAKLFLPISNILGLFSVKSITTSHVKAFIYQYYAWRDGLGVYGMFIGKK